MTPIKSSKISQNLLLAQFLELFFVVIATLIVFLIFNTLMNYFKIELIVWFNYLILITVSGIASAIFARFIFHNLSEKPMTEYKFDNENDELKHQFHKITQQQIISNSEMGMETAERLKAEKTLSDSEAQLRVVINKAPIGIVLLDKDVVIMECNPAFQTMLGYDREELIGVAFNQAIHPANVVQSKKQFTELIEGRIDVYRMEQSYIHKDLRKVWGSISASTVRNTNGEIRFIILMIEDITERRQAEKKISGYQKKLRLLTSRLSLVEEHKRHLCATNLHDHIGQVLLYIRLKIGKLQQDHDGKHPDLGEIINLIDQVIKCTRSLIYELSPPILYELGLEETIEWLSENLTKQHGIQTKLKRDNQPKPLDTEMSIVLFQAVREVMDNIVKHAKATLATTSINRDPNDLIVIVEDNGVGFDPRITDLQLPKNHGLGLFGIGEQLEHVGGRLEIKSEPGKGTRVTISVPMGCSNKKNWTDLLKKDMPTCNS